MKATIVLLPGDGIGPEVVREGRLVLEAVAARFGHELAFDEQRIGGIAIDEDGDPLPAATLEACAKADAILLGAVGGPKWDDPRAKTRPEQGLLGLRKGLGLFANLRPVRVFPALAAASPLKPERLEGVDMLFVRELTGGLYFGKPRLPRGRERQASRRRHAGVQRGRDRAASSGSPSRSRAGGRSASPRSTRPTCSSRRGSGARSPSRSPPSSRTSRSSTSSSTPARCASSRSRAIVRRHRHREHVRRHPHRRGGGAGRLARPAARARRSARARAALYEPIHGSAPDIAGKGIANPIGTILSAAMLLRHSLGLGREAELVERAVGAGRRGGRAHRGHEPAAGRGALDERDGRADPPRDGEAGGRAMKPNPVTMSPVSQVHVAAARRLSRGVSVARDVEGELHLEVFMDGTSSSARRSPTRAPRSRAPSAPSSGSRASSRRASSRSRRRRRARTPRTWRPARPSQRTASSASSRTGTRCSSTSSSSGTSTRCCRSSTRPRWARPCERFSSLFETRARHVGVA